MAQANFYELYTTSTKIAFPKLVEKILTTNESVQVVCSNDAEVSFYDMLLWTYSQLSFIPHGAYLDGSKESQIVYITLKISDNPLKSKICFIYDFDIVTSEQILEEMSKREKLLFMYEADSEKSEKADKIRSKIADVGISTLLIKEKNGVWS